VILLYLGLLLGPALLIFLWDRFVFALVPRAWVVYRITGSVGTPFHELAHAAACLVFGLRITKMALYAPDRASGTMGYVNFSYNPRSLRHQVGCLIQGIAPLIAGGFLVVIILGASAVAPPAPGATAFAQWLWTASSDAMLGSYHLALESARGALLALLLVIISMHCIPSVADIRIGLRGFLTLLAIGAGVLLALHALTGFAPQDSTLPNFIASALAAFEAGLWWMMRAAVSVVTLALVGSLLFILLPAFAFRAVYSLVRPQRAMSQADQ
jgi:hypothetical protein